MGALLSPLGPCASASPGTMALGWGWGAGQGRFPGAVTCARSPFAAPPLPFTACVFFAIDSRPCLSPPKKLGSHTPQNPPGRGSLAVLSWSCSCHGPDLRRAQALQVGSWPLQLLLPGIIIPVRNNFAWGIFCKEFVVITGTKVCRRKLFFFKKL